jgi:hypothetical protein
MKLIPLSQGKYAKVDDEDYAELSRYVWYACRVEEKFFYAATNIILDNGNKYNLKMQRKILKLEKDEFAYVYHINHDGLDNRKENLKIITYQKKPINPHLSQKKRINPPLSRFSSRIMRDINYMKEKHCLYF